MTWNLLRENKFSWSKMALRQCEKIEGNWIKMWGFLWEISMPRNSILSTFIFVFSEWVKECVGRFITVGEAAQLSLKTRGSILTDIFWITEVYSYGTTWKKNKIFECTQAFENPSTFYDYFDACWAFRTHSILQWPHHPSQTSLV